MRNEGERVVIGRVVKGGAAERSGQLHPGDEVLEVNGLKLKGKSVHDICDTLCQMTGSPKNEINEACRRVNTSGVISGTLTFVIVPGSGHDEAKENMNGGVNNAQVMPNQPEMAAAVVHPIPEQVQDEVVSAPKMGLVPLFMKLDNVIFSCTTARISTTTPTTTSTSPATSWESASSGATSCTSSTGKTSTGGRRTGMESGHRHWPV